MLAVAGEDFRPLALAHLLRKANLARLLKRRVDVIAEYERGDIGEAQFKVALRRMAIAMEMISD
jgi:hypothetical protein